MLHTSLQFSATDNLGSSNELDEMSFRDFIRLKLFRSTISTRVLVNNKNNNSKRRVTVINRQGFPALSQQPNFVFEGVNTPISGTSFLTALISAILLDPK